MMAWGIDAVRNYERVKRFYTRYGNALERTYAAAVDGRVGGIGDPDVITRLGSFEFCAEANTKNSAGDAAQRARGNVIVQVAGRTRNGRISGEEFLRRHGIPKPDRIAGECEVAALTLAKDEIEAEVP